MGISEQEIDKVLSRGSGFADGKLRIYKHFNENHNVKQSSEFLKNEYGTGGWGGELYSDHDSKGIRIKNPKTQEEILLTWDKVSQKISMLISQDKYLTIKEKIKYGLKQVDTEIKLIIVQGRKNVIDGQCSMF